jgi:cob(I)alamin adenosyltransferase
MSKIYTKSGDGGTTGLPGGNRVSKLDLRIEANGEIDELNALIGLVRASLSGNEETCSLLKAIQQLLMAVMAHVAASGKGKPDGLSGMCSRLEAEIDRLAAGNRFCFMLPGGSREEALVHVARAKTRTAERRLWAVNERYTLAADVMQFMNRLSDYLFALAIGLAEDTAARP